MATHEATILEGMGFNAETKTRLKIRFAYTHLMAAKDAAMQAHGVNRAVLAGAGEARNLLLKSVPVAIVMAAAALEANVNEIIQDKLDDPPGSLTECIRKLLEDLIDDRSGNSIDRYDRLALLSDKLPDRGTQAWENAKILVQFRNYFMHMKPSWDDDDIHHSKLAKQMQSKVPIEEIYRDKFIFPHAVMTYQCSKWAITTVLTFASDYSSLMGVENVFALNGADFTLPDNGQKS